jgi:hypothetical protein
VAIEKARRATEKPNLCTECETDNCPKGFIRTMLCACCKNRHEPIPENQS